MIREFPEDPAAPVFFVSYARAHPPDHPISAPVNVNTPVRRFFTDLNAVVQELLAPLPGQDPGFIDVMLNAGEIWAPYILAAVGSCQVFVALVSPPYLQTSQWAAMEWDAFSQRNCFRRSDGLPAGITCIIPVRWAPIDKELPPAVAKVNWFMPTDMPEDIYEVEYHKYGVLGLLRMGREDAYQSVVWRLALQIRDFTHSHWVEPRPPGDLSKLDRTFGRGQQ